MSALVPPYRFGTVFVSVLVALAAAQMAHGAAAESLGEVHYESPSPLFNTSDPVLLAAERAAGEELNARRTARGSSKARERRLASRGNYADLLPADAATLARQRFPQWLTASRDAEDLLSEGRKITGYVGESYATLETATGNPAGVMYSSLPLVTRPDGPAIDLSLLGDDRGFRPREPRVPVGLPLTAEQPASFERSGIRFSLVGAQASRASEHAGRLFYADVYGGSADTDYILTATTYGAEAFWHLRSAQSPEQFRLRFELPDSATLVADPVSGGVTVERAGQVLARIPTPTATDADDEYVEMATRVDGSDLVIDVPHRSADLEYPLLVDPVINEYEIKEEWSEWAWDTEGTAKDCGDWASQTPWKFEQWTNGGAAPFIPLCTNDYWGKGLWTYMTPGANYITQAAAYHTWTLRAGTYVKSAMFRYIRHRPATTRGFVGIYKGLDWIKLWEEWGPNTNGYVEWSPYSLAGAPPRVDSGPMHDASPYLNNPNPVKVGAGLISNATGIRQYGADFGVQHVVLILDDEYAPDDVQFTSVQPPLSASTVGSSNRETAWFDPQRDGNPVRLALRAHDWGLGLKAITVIPSADPTNTLIGPYTNETCDGHRYAPCGADAWTAEEPTRSDANVGIHRIPDGINEIMVQTADVVGNVTNSANIPNGTGGTYTGRINLKIDRTAPKIELSGSLWDGRNKDLYGSSYRLHVKATDGSQASLSTRQSGVERLEVTLDGRVISPSAGDGTTQTCATDSCSLEPSDFVVDDSKIDLPRDGAHSISVTAWDKLGHRSPTQEIAFWLVRPGDQAELNADAPESSLADVDDTGAVEACTSDPNRYCGSEDAANDTDLKSLTDPPLISDSGSRTVSYNNWGLADEHGEVFDERKAGPLVDRLGLTRFRKIIDWDIATTWRAGIYNALGKDDVQLRRMNLWYNNFLKARERNSGIEAMVTFKYSDLNIFQNAGLPGGSTPYIDAVNRFRQTYPEIAVFGAWNEPNVTKYTSLTGAREAGRRFNDLWKACKDPLPPLTAGGKAAPRCKVIAGEFSDRGLSTNYLREYIEKAGITEKQKNGKVTWGFHLYDTQYYRTLTQPNGSHPTTYRFFLRQTRGPVWITEAGVFQWHLRQGKNVRERPDTENASVSDFNYLLDEVLPFTPVNQTNRLQRFYYYHWADTFTSGAYENVGETQYDSYGTGLSAHPLGPVRKPYCVYLKRHLTASWRTCDEL